MVLVPQYYVVLCGMGVSEMWHCVVWDTLLVSILGPAWRQSRTLGGVASQPAYAHWQDEEEKFGGHQKIKLSRLGHWSGATASFKYLRERK